MKVQKITRTSLLTVALAFVSTFGLTTVATAIPAKVECNPFANLVTEASASTETPGLTVKQD